RRARRLHVVRLDRERGRRGRAALGLDRTGLDLRFWRFSWDDLGDDLGLGLGWLSRRRRLGSRLCLLGFGLRRWRSRDLRLLWRRGPWVGGGGGRGGGGRPRAGRSCPAGRRGGRAVLPTPAPP